MPNSRIMMEKRAAGLLIFRHFLDNVEYLLLRASYGDHHWTPPKGHVDPGEDDFSTALRETKEEAGYDAQDLKIYKDHCHILKYEVKGRPKVVIYWLAELKNPLQLVKLSSEHTEYQWLDKEAAKALAGHEDMQNMIDVFSSVIPTL